MQGRWKKPKVRFVLDSGWTMTHHPSQVHGKPPSPSPSPPGRVAAAGLRIYFCSAGAPRHTPLRHERTSLGGLNSAYSSALTAAAGPSWLNTQQTPAAQRTLARHGNATGAMRGAERLWALSLALLSALLTGATRSQVSPLLALLRRPYITCLFCVV